MNEDEEFSEEERAEAEAFAAALDRPVSAKAGSDAAFALGLAANQKASLPDPEVQARAIERALDAGSRAQRGRTWRPLLLAAAVLLIAVPAVGRLNQLLEQPSTAVSTGFPTADLPSADAVLGAPIDDAQPASERARMLGRARTRAYFSALLADERDERGER